eukprot:tig00021723_g23248.t1
MGASYTITCSGANLTAYAGTVTGAALTSHRRRVKHDEHELVDGSIAVRQVGGAAVGDGLVERGGRCFGGGVLEYDGASGTEPAYANVTVSCSSNGVADLGLERDSGLGDGDGLGHGAVHAKTVENVTVGTPIPQSTTSVTVPVSWALSAVGYSGTTWRRRTGAGGWGDERQRDRLGAPRDGASYTITCSGANLTAAQLVDGSIAVRKSVGRVGDGLVERGGRCFGGGVLEYDGERRHGAGVQSHVTSCAATVYYSYLGVASSATAYSTVHAKTVENVTVGTPIPQSTTS